MVTVLTVLILIVCILLIGIVVIQNPKGGGISSGFGAVNQIAGVKSMNEGVENGTKILAGVLFVLCLASAKFMGGSGAAAGEGEVNYNEAQLETTTQTEGVNPGTSPAPGK